MFVVPCRLDNIGRSGSEASFWLTTGDTNLWKNALAELSPTVVTILFGVNECINNRTPASYSNNLASLVGMVRNAAPNSDVILITPPDIGAVTTYPMSAYVTNVAAIAGSMGCGYVDVYSAWGPYGSHPEWYLNSTHPNAAGGAVIAGYVYGLLFSTPTARISSMAMTSVKFQ